MLSVEGKMLHLEERLRMGDEIMKTYIYEVVLELLPVANWPIAVLQCLSVIKNPLGIRLPFYD